MSTAGTIGSEAGSPIAESCPASSSLISVAIRQFGTFAVKVGSSNVRPVSQWFHGSAAVDFKLGRFMNNIIYIVGLIVVVLAILSFLGLR
ncbi:hypothetical protein EV560_112199 [Bosea sp. BK604]|nr:hypothetical protein EV560_112199 [Bosea sp. BK604]